MGQPVRTDLSEVIAENFGANATYVEGLLSRFRSNPELVDESWRAYFAELLGDGDSSRDCRRQLAALDEDIRITENGGRNASTSMPTAAASGATVAKAAAPAKAEHSPSSRAKQSAARHQVEHSRSNSHSRRRAQDCREHGGESFGSDGNFAATHSGKTAGRKPPHHQQTSSGKRSRQSFLHASDRLGPAARAR